MLDYFSSKKSKAKETKVKERKPERRPSEPLLTDDDEEFLSKITAQIEGTPPPLPQRPFDLPIAGETEGNNAQLILFDEARRVPLPDIPDTPYDEVKSSKEPQVPLSPITPISPSAESKRKRWSFMQFGSKGRDRKATATGLDSAIAGLKATETKEAQSAPVTQSEAEKENEEIEQVLEQLNMASINNRAFSFSDESRELLHKYMNDLLYLLKT